MTQYEGAPIGSKEKDKKNMQNKDIFGSVSNVVFNHAEKEMKNDPAFDYMSPSRTPGFGGSYF